MQPSNYFYQVQIKRQEFEREICQRMLFRLTLTHSDNRRGDLSDVLARLGGWLIRQGEYLETRYSQCTEACVPARPMAKAR